MTTEGRRRKLNARICRGCRQVFQPTSALQRYGRKACKALRTRYLTYAVPGAKVTHP